MTEKNKKILKYSIIAIVILIVIFLGIKMFTGNKNNVEQNQFQQEQGFGGPGDQMMNGEPPSGEMGTPPEGGPSNGEMPPENPNM